MSQSLIGGATTAFVWPRLSWKTALALLAALIAIALAAIVVRRPPAQVEVARADLVVARVNGESIHEREVRRLLSDPAIRLQLLTEHARRQTARTDAAQGEPASVDNSPSDSELERLALRRLIVQRLLVDEANRRQLAVSDHEVKAALMATQRRFKDAEAYEAWRRSVELDEPAMIDAIRAEMLAGRARAALMNEARPSDAQVRAYYDVNKAGIKTAETVRLQVMAVPDEALARRLVKSLNNGEDFARVAAREKDKGVRAIESEKAVGVETSRLPPDVRSRVEKLKVGRTQGPIKDGDEYLVIRLAERQPSRPKSFDEARPEIEQKLSDSMQRQQVSAWLAAQRKTAKVEVLRPQLAEN